MGEALRLLTVWPWGSVRPSPGRATVVFFPVVGLLLGLAWALPGFLFAHRLPSGGITAALVLLIDAALTRGMHLDALADVADGAASGRSGDEGIAIMRDPTIGAIGAAALVLVCLLRYGALTFSADFGHRLFAAPGTGRAAMVLLVAWLPVLQDGSVGHRLAASSRWAVLAAAVVAVVAVLPSGGPGVQALAFGLIAAVGYGLWVRGRFGELSRDAIGAGCILAETVALVVLSID